MEEITNSIFSSSLSLFSGDSFNQPTLYKHSIARKLCRNAKQIISTKSEPTLYNIIPMVPFKSTRLQLSREEMKEIFREHDIDGDGVLSIAEITQAFSFLGNLLPFYKAHYGLAFADADGDGFIAEDELDSLVDYAMKFHAKKCVK